MPVLVPSGMLKRFECFVYHKVQEKSHMELMEEMRQKYIDLAVFVNISVPDGKPKSLALAHLEDSLMRSIQAIAMLGIADATEYV